MGFLLDYFCPKKEETEKDNITTVKYEEPKDLISSETQEDKNSSTNSGQNKIIRKKIKNDSLIDKEHQLIEMENMNKKGNENINEIKRYNEKTTLEKELKELKSEKKNFDIDKQKLEKDKKALKVEKEQLKKEQKDFIKKKSKLEKWEEELNKKRDELNNREKNLKEEKKKNDKELNDEKEKLIEETKKLNQKEINLNIKDKDLELMKNNLKLNTENIDKKEKDLEARKETLDKREQDIINQEEILRKKDEEFNIKRKKQEESINKKNKELSDKKENLIKNENTLKEKESELVKKDEDLKVKQSKLEEEQSELKVKQSKLEEEKSELKVKQSKLVEEQSKLEENRSELKEKQTKLEEKKSKLDEEQSELEGKKSKLDEEQSELKEQKSKLEEEQSELKEQKSKLEQKQSELNEQKSQLEQKQSELKENQSKLEERQTLLTVNENRFTQEKLLQEKKFKQKEETLNKFKFSLDQEKKDFEEQKKKEILLKLPNLVGLQNIGATCYMNATLQALSNTNLLTEYFLNKSKFDPNSSNKKMAKEYYKVLTNLWSDTKKDGDYAPYDFKQALSEENPLFAGIQANDSKDLINFLLERFHHELNNPKPNNNDNNIFNVNQMDEMQTLKAFITDYFKSNQSIITDCFYGILETKSKCGGCQCIKFNFQIYSFLEFPLEQVNIYMYQMGKRFNMMNQGQKNPDIDLLECFDYYQKIDIMNGQNQMYCNFCNANMDTYYGTTIYSLPNYLIINLNRGKGAVYECNVNFPENLNLLNYVSFKQGKTYFQLYAVICHLGPSSMSGHFVAYCRHRKNNKWYKYNDSFVTECTKAQEYNEGMPYILFYKAV